jgi:CheY-like chemotaxis protein
MVTGKRALIVDDSRSARVILSRMLEQHGMTVDTAESAEQALEYLQQSRPDVIFMDHLMPGMDGFQAVQVIKSDPQTAMIPLMMYTSQEGELYVSQARALGAIGVLPKTVRPVDVSRVLYQLRLLPERRTQRSALFDGSATMPHLAAADALESTATVAALGGPAAAAPAPGPFGSPAPLAATTTMTVPPALFAEMQASLRQSTQQLVKDQLGEQRRFVLATFEAFARRLSNEIKEGIAKMPVAPTIEPSIPPPPARQWWPVTLTALCGVLPALVLGWLYWQTFQTNQQLSGELAKSQAANAAAQAAVAASAVAGMPAAVLPAAAAVDGRGGPPSGPMATEYVPYGETPLANARLDRLRGLAATLEAQKFKGRIRIEAFVGDFCLTGNAGEGYSVADTDLAAQKCDLVGNPFEDALSPAQHQSVDFANFVATLRQRTGGAIVVDVVTAGRRSQLAYPEQGEKATAGEWNTIAAQNNRVEFRVIPAA